MKKFLAVFLVGLLFLPVISCKTVFNTIVEPGVDLIANQDLLVLQGVLLYSKKSEGHWPADVPELLENIKNDSLEVYFSKFEFLKWNQVGDSLLVSYRLNYAGSDKTEYSFLAGKFYLQPNLDTLKSRHFQVVAERKDKTLRFESTPKKVKR